jgi:hypothetical protein
MENTKQDSKITGLQLLREPFPANQISKLPKPYSKDAKKGQCSECGGYHGLPAIHLDYVGHAALTDRLLDVDPHWNWEPLSLDSNGNPLVDKDGGMWIKLTILGVTRLGYGDSQGKTGVNATKERIGDALRNAAMRFGAALDLWHKGDLHVQEEQVMALPESAFEDYLLTISEASTIDQIKITLKYCVTNNATKDQLAILQAAATKRKNQLTEGEDLDVISQ